MSRALVVTDSNVDHLHGDRFVRSLEAKYDQVDRLVIPAGERTKNLDAYVQLVRAFAQLGLTRADTAYALGGGVVGDLTGFAAATYMRGIDFVQVPTTLLAMVDSSIGGKTGVDIPEGKNLVGAFHLPREIIRDVGYLKTLPKRELMNGLAEMIKTAILFDRDLFASIRALAGEDLLSRPDRLEPLIVRTAAWKEKIVAADFREGGSRKLLNLGHTFGHAIEAASDFQLGHGVCVALGLRLVGSAVPEIAEILDAFGYPTLEVDAQCLRICCNAKRGSDTWGSDIPVAAFKEAHSVELVAKPHLDRGRGVSPRQEEGEFSSVRRGETPRPQGFATASVDSLSLELTKTKVLSYLASDKKRAGNLVTLVLPRAIGRCELVETPLHQLGDYLESI